MLLDLYQALPDRNAIICTFMRLQQTCFVLVVMRAAFLMSTDLILRVFVRSKRASIAVGICSMSRDSTIAHGLLVEKGERSVIESSPIEFTLAKHWPDPRLKVSICAKKRNHMRFVFLCVLIQYYTLCCD